MPGNRESTIWAVAKKGISTEPRLAANTAATKKAAPPKASRHHG
jgi:hypothetical protein